MSKRLSKIDRQFSQGRDAFNALAHEFYSARTSTEQEFFRCAALLKSIDPSILAAFYGAEAANTFLQALESCRLPLARQTAGGYELHDFFRDFLKEKFLEHVGATRRATWHKAVGDYHGDFDRIGTVVFSVIKSIGTRSRTRRRRERDLAIL